LSLFETLFPFVSPLKSIVWLAERINEVGKKPDRFDEFILLRELDIELESVVGLSLSQLR